MKSRSDTVYFCFRTCRQPRLPSGFDNILFQSNSFIFYRAVYEGGLKSSYSDNDAMVKFDQMRFIYQQVSPAVHTLLPLVLQRLDSGSIEALILILEKSPQLQINYDFIIGPILLFSKVVFFRLGNINIQMVPSQENMDSDQPIQSRSDAQQPLQPQTCV